MSSPLAWLGAVLVGHLAAAHLLWHLGETAPERLPSDEARRMARWLVLAGVPVLALALRVPDAPADLGLAWPARPLAALLSAAALGVAVAACLERAAAVDPLAPPRPRAPRPTPAAMAEAAADTLALAAHWAFVRAAVLAAGVGAADRPAGGTAVMAVTLAVLGLELAGDPARRLELRAGRPSQATARLVALAALDATAFALAGSMLATVAAQAAARATWLVTEPHGAAAGGDGVEAGRAGRAPRPAHASVSLEIEPTVH